MQDSDFLSRDEIKKILIKVHRENQALWSKWFQRISDPSEKSGLYRYREGFDTAILNLAQYFQVSLSPPKSQRLGTKKEEKAKVISLEKIFVQPDAEGVHCIYCNQLLFKKGKKLWHCPVCGINFRPVEEE